MAELNERIPTESTEQQWLFNWARVMQGRFPELALMYHVPNEGHRNTVTGYRLRAEGLRRGVPDICLPVARSGYHGLYIELKRQRGGRVSPEQAAWIEKLAEQGYCAVVCAGFEVAKGVIEKYIAGKMERGDS